MKRNLLLVLLLFFSFTIVAKAANEEEVIPENKSVIKGSISDSKTGEPLIGVNVFVEQNPTVGASTDFDGNFQFEVEKGAYKIIMSLIGYKNVEKEVVVGSDVVDLTTVMSEDSEVLGEVKVVGTARKESQQALIAEQKRATIIRESVGAEQLSNQGVSNAAVATTKISGVTKLEGSSRVYVRGLGDRYTMTTLNGLPLPSNDPRLKNISLDLFATDIIQNVGVSKTFYSALSGDVAGADIDITTKEVSGNTGVAIGVSVGANSQTTGKEFKKIDGTNWYGIADNVEHPVTDLKKYPFTDNISLLDGKGKPKFGLSLSGGKSFGVGENGRFSAFLTASFSNDYSYNEGFSINYYTRDRKGSSYSSAKEYKYKTSKLAMANLVYRLNNNNKISYTSLLIHSNSQAVQDYYGTKPDVAEGGGTFANLILQTENQNVLFVNQLFSSHKIGELWDLDLAVAYNRIANDEPNRKRNVFIVNKDKEEIKFANGTPRNNSRYYHNLEENDLVGKISIKKYFGESRLPEAHTGKLSLGYDFRRTSRRFDAYYFDHDLFTSSAIKGKIDEVFTQQNLDSGLFQLKTGYGFADNALDPFWNTGKRTINGAYGILDYRLSNKLYASLGVRFENLKMDVEWKTNLSSSHEQGTPQSLNKNYVLPSLNLKYELNEEHQIRFAGSRTYTYPQFKEIAPFVYEGISYTESGNQKLKPSDNYNLDLKWEWFLNRGELISVAVFGKYIKDAINRIEGVAASDNQFTFFNTGDAKVYGVEAEIKKDLFSFSQEDDDYISKIKCGLNASYMSAEQKFNTIPGFDPTTQTESLEGASPFVLNADISYHFVKDEKKTTAFIVLNYQHEKLYAVGTEGTASIIQKPTAMLDFVFKHSFNKHFGFKCSMKNILDTKFERYRNLNDVLVTRSYKKGASISLGINYKF